MKTIEHTDPSGGDLDWSLREDSSSSFALLTIRGKTYHMTAGQLGALGNTALDLAKKIREQVAKKEARKKAQYFRWSAPLMVPATESEQVFIRETWERISRLRQEVENLRFHPEVESLRRKIQSIESACTHEFVYDTPGSPYDLRRCALCGYVVDEI